MVYGYRFNGVCVIILDIIETKFGRVSGYTGST